MYSVRGVLSNKNTINAIVASTSVAGALMEVEDAIAAEHRAAVEGMPPEVVKPVAPSIVRLIVKRMAGAKVRIAAPRKPKSTPTAAPAAAAVSPAGKSGSNHGGKTGPAPAGRR